MRFTSCESRAEALRFPYSEISGSKVARHLTEAYRSYAPSFIAILCQGIHHMLLNFPLGNLKTILDKQPLFIKISCLLTYLYFTYLSPPLEKTPFKGRRDRIHFSKIDRSECLGINFVKSKIDQIRDEKNRFRSGFS